MEIYGTNDTTNIPAACRSSEDLRVTSELVLGSVQLSCHGIQKAKKVPTIIPIKVT